MFVWHINIMDIIVLGIIGLIVLGFSGYLGVLYLINKIKGDK